MGIRFRGHVVALCVVFSGIASIAAAQEAATSFEQLRRSVKNGDAVTVTDPAGEPLKGQIVDLSASSLTLLVSGSDDSSSGELRLDQFPVP